MTIPEADGRRGEWRDDHSEANLTAEREATSDMTSEERASHNSYLIGAVSGFVPPELWERAVATARKDACRHRPKAVPA